MRKRNQPCTVPCARDAGLRSRTQLFPPLPARAFAPAPHQAFPTDEEMEDRACKTCGEYFERLIKDGALKSFVATHSVDWQEQQEEGRRLDDVLEKLLSMIILRLDIDGNRVVDTKDFALADKTD
jgi:hypothetical protein